MARRRIDVAKNLVQSQIVGKLDQQFKVEVLSAGEGVTETAARSHQSRCAQLRSPRRARRRARAL